MIDSVPYYKLSGAHLKKFRKRPPEIWIVPWREGKAWKGSRILAWSAQDALDRFAQHMQNYGRSTLQLLQIRLKRVRLERRMPSDVLQRLRMLPDQGLCDI